MFEAKLKTGSTWKKIVEAINKDIVSSALFDCSSNGITLQGMDSSHICLVNLLLRGEGFDFFRCDRNIALGVHIESLIKLLKCASNDDQITLSVDENNSDNLTMTFESIKEDKLAKVAKYEMKLIDLDQEHLGIPDQDYSCTVKMPSAEFSRICRDLTQIGDTVIITCAKDGISFSCAGDLGTGNVRLTQTSNVDGKDEDTVSIDMKEGLTLNFSLRYLIHFTKAAALTNQVTLKLAPNVPLVAEYLIEDLGHIRYYLAPKLDEDAE